MDPSDGLDSLSLFFPEPTLMIFLCCLGIVNTRLVGDWGDETARSPNREIVSFRAVRAYARWQCLVRTG